MTPKIYKTDTLEKIKPIIEKAQKLWNEATLKLDDAHGDRGSCVLSDGIYVFFLPPRCRKPVRKMIISCNHIGKTQGSINREQTKDIALNYLTLNKVDAYYSYGRMD